MRFPNLHKHRAISIKKSLLHERIACKGTSPPRLDVLSDAGPSLDLRLESTQQRRRSQQIILGPLRDRDGEHDPRVQIHHRARVAHEVAALAGICRQECLEVRQEPWRALFHKRTDVGLRLLLLLPIRLCARVAAAARTISSACTRQRLVARGGVARGGTAVTICN
jgi:hypothetical protein